MARKHGFFRPHVNGLTAIHSTTLRDGGTWVLSGSQLDLDFAHSRAFNRSTGFNGSPDGILTYTSPSPKLVYGADGVLGYAPHNLIPYSGEFTNAAWLKTNGDVTLVGSEYLLTATAVTGFPGRIYQAPAVLTGFTYTVFVVAKKGTQNFIQFYVNNQSADFANFDLDAGVVGTKGASSTSSITSIGDGYYLCAFSYTAGSTDRHPFLYMAPSASATRAQSWTSAGTETIYLQYAQFSIGSSALTYIPTTSAAVYSLPIDHDPITHAPLGVLIEEQRTNLLLRSQEFGATWNIGSSSVTADQDTAPDGTVTADLVTMVINSGVFQTVSVSQSTAYTLSFWVKRGTKTELRYRVYDNIGAANITAPTSYYSSTSSGEFSRVTHTFTTPVGCTSLRVYLDDSNDGSSGTFFAWGAQLEAGAFATSYIPTVASQVSRAADQVSILTSAFGYNVAAGAAVIDFRPTYVDDGSEFQFFAFHYFESSIRYIRAKLETTTARTGELDFTLRGSLTVGQSSPTDAYAPGTQTMKWGLTWDAAVMRSSYDGNTMGAEAATAMTLPAPTVVYLGHNSTLGSYINGHIKRFTHFASLKSQAELNGLTA